MYSNIEIYISEVFQQISFNLQDLLSLFRKINDFHIQRLHKVLTKPSTEDTRNHGVT